MKRRNMAGLVFVAWLLTAASANATTYAGIRPCTSWLLHHSEAIVLATITESGAEANEWETTFQVDEVLWGSAGETLRIPYDKWMYPWYDRCPEFLDGQYLLFLRAGLRECHSTATTYVHPDHAKQLRPLRSFIAAASVDAGKPRLGAIRDLVMAHLSPGVQGMPEWAGMEDLAWWCRNEGLAHELSTEDVDAVVKLATDRELLVNDYFAPRWYGAAVSIVALAAPARAPDLLFMLWERAIGYYPDLGDLVRHQPAFASVEDRLLNELFGGGSVRLLYAWRYFLADEMSF